MKKLYIILILLSSQILHSQYVFSLDTDVSNLINGSEATNYKSALDLRFRILSVGSNRSETGVFYERFQKIYYSSTGMTHARKLIDTGDIMLLLNVEVSYIKRFYPNKAKLMYLSYGGGGEFRIFKGNMGLISTYYFKYRTDQQYWNAIPKWVGTFTVGIAYKLNGNY